MRCENKTFLQNDPGFLQEISSTAVEVGLGSARPLFHLPPTLLDAQVNPFVGEDLEALVVADLAAPFGQARARHIFGPAFPLSRVAELVVGPPLVLRVFVLAGERSRPHGVDRGEFRLDPLDALLDLCRAFAVPWFSIIMLYSS